MAYTRQQSIQSPGPNKKRSRKNLGKYRVVELYCGIYWDSCWNEEETIIRFDSGTGPEGAEEVANPEYDPSVPKPIPPVFCRQMVGVDCLKNNCRHVAYCYADEEDAEPGEASPLTRT